MENKETIEEFIRKSYLSRLENHLSVDFEDGVKLGAKWQQERMYSEEEVLQILFRFTNKFDLQKNIEITAEMQKEWFEQFKK